MNIKLQAIETFSKKLMMILILIKDRNIMRKEILLNIQYWVNQIGLIKLNLERNRHNLMNLTFDNFLKNHKQK